MAHGPQILWRDNDNSLVLENVRAQSSGVILNNAVGTVTMYDRQGVATPSGGPFNVNYLAGTQGGYTCIIPATATVALPDDTTWLQLVIRLTGPTGQTFVGILDARLKENML